MKTTHLQFQAPSFADLAVLYLSAICAGVPRLLGLLWALPRRVIVECLHAGVYTPAGTLMRAFQVALLLASYSWYVFCIFNCMFAARSLTITFA